MTAPLLAAVAEPVIIGGLIVVVMAAVIILYGVLALFGTVFTRRAEEGPNLVERAAELRQPRTAFDRFDSRFARMVRGTLFGLTPETAVSWILLAGALAAVISYIITPNELIALGAFLLGAAVPLFVFLLFQHRRRRAIQEQLPDGCFQLARSLRSGLALPAALRETEKYLPTPLSSLFSRLATALTLGESTEPAVYRVADDAATTEFDLLASVIITNVRSGGNLPAMLDRLAASIRDRNQYRGYFRSVTALSRLSGFALAMAGPLVVIFYLVFQPDLFTKFVYAPFGQILLIAAVVLEVLGLIWLLWLLSGQEKY